MGHQAAGDPGPELRPTTGGVRSRKRCQDKRKRKHKRTKRSWRAHDTPGISTGLAGSPSFHWPPNSGEDTSARLARRQTAENKERTPQKLAKATVQKGPRWRFVEPPAAFHMGMRSEEPPPTVLAARAASRGHLESSTITSSRKHLTRLGLGIRI